MAGVASVGARGLTDPRRAAAVTPVEWTWPDRRRALQLALATIWLLDGVLQLQPFMFTRAFGSQMLAGVAAGNPAPVASSIAWLSHQVAAHPGVANLGFAVVQLSLGIGIAWRRTLRAALAVSVVWALGVWWFGEGLGGMLARTASPLTGAPGAALLYILLAALLWPVRADAMPEGEAVARRPVGTVPAKLLWIALWGVLGWTCLWSVNRGPHALSSQLVAAGGMAPGWAARLDHSFATAFAGHGLQAAIALAVFFGIVAVAVLVPPKAARPIMLTAILVALAIWVLGESFGGIMMGQGTDPNSGPLLVLLVAAYWPVRKHRPAVSAEGS